MSLLLGIDTGGTYTDGVLFDEARKRVVATAKALTDRHDLNRSIGSVIMELLAARPKSRAGKRIGFVALSTTLATNAIVERHGFPAGLVMIGQSRGMLDRAGLGTALAGGPVIFIDGGHDAEGKERQAPDIPALEAVLDDLAAKVSAFAVCGYFAVRNPGHEIMVRDLLRARTGLPVTCSHELATDLDAPRRALTALLNARLIALIQQLILATQNRLQALDIEAPLMVVKGDGSLISADTALARPVETILSGPAASVVGARFLADAQDCVVTDIGGTTTDIAVLQDGQPLPDPHGARVGGFRTMVAAVAVHTLGLGGDSEIGLDEAKNLTAGPRRAVPLSLLAHLHPEIIDRLATQVARPAAKPHDGRFALRLRDGDAGGRLSRNESALWEQLDAGPMALEELLAARAPEQPLQRLIDRGLVILSCFTPSDAAHVLGLQDDWAAAAARHGAALWARRERRPGLPVATDAMAFAGLVVETVTRLSARALVLAALAAQQRSEGDAGNGISDLTGDKLPAGFWDMLLDDAAAADAEKRIIAMQARLNSRLIAIGAPAATYYPAIAERLSAPLTVPPHAAVCNAVGAVAGGVSQRAEITVTCPQDGIYRLHTPEGIEDFENPQAAAERAGTLALATATAQASAAGAVEIRTKLKRKERIAHVTGGREIYVEGRFIATAYGRPRIAGE